MKTFTKLFPVLMLLLTFSFSTQASNANSKTWIKDLEYLRDTFPVKHANAFFKISEDEFNSEINSIIADVDSLTDDEIMMRMREAIVKVGDSHTSVYGTQKSSDNKVLPFELFWFEDGIYVIKSNKENSSLLGHKIIAMNNTSIDSVVNSFRKLMVVDNNSMLKNKMSYQLLESLNYKYYGINDSEIIKITLQDMSGEVVEADVAFLERGSFKLSEDLNAKNKSFCLTGLKHEIRLLKQKEDSILYMQYNACATRETWKMYKEYMKDQSLMSSKFFQNMFFNYKIISTPTFKKTANKIFKEADKENYTKLVIDLRHNGGGSSTICSEFLDSIMSYNIEVCGITGRKTFSSGTDLAAEMGDKGMKLYGENTGGMAQAYGEVKFFVLPSNNVRIYYSTMFYVSSENYTNTVNPDVETEFTISDYCNGIDSAYEAVKMN